MKKVYVVWHEERLLEFYCSGCDAIEREFRKIFESEEKAIGYIQDEIKNSLENVNAMSFDYEYFIDHVPSVDEITQERCVKYYDTGDIERTYSYTDQEVY